MARKVKIAFHFQCSHHIYCKVNTYALNLYNSLKVNYYLLLQSCCMLIMLFFCPHHQISMKRAPAAEQDLF